MAKNRFLRCVGGRYDFRRRVPPDLVARFGGKRELIRSIGSVPFAEAMERARRLTVATDRLFKMIAKKPDLTPDQIADLVEDWFARRVESQEKWREQFHPTDVDDGERAQRISQDRADGAIELIRLNDTGVAAETAEALLRAHGIAVDPKSPAFTDLCRAILRANAEAARVHAARMAGDYTVKPSDPLLANALSAERQVKKAVPTFGDAWSRYTAERTRAGAWRPSMSHDVEQARAMFVEVVGDKRLDRYTRQDVHECVAVLQALPAHRSKKPQFRGKTLAQLVELTKADPSLETLTPVSVKKYAGIVSSFFAWCVDQGFMTENIGRGVYKPPKRQVRRSAERDAWSPEQLRQLFTSPLYAGAKSANYRTEPGTKIIRDHCWWLPVLALYHPCRLEELAQLRVDDVREDGGILYFDIHADDGDDGEAPGRRLKSLAAVRRVPLHHVALDLGFRDHLAERRRKGDVMLWPQLKPGGMGRKYGFAFSKWFGRYREAVGIDGVDFHSFRHASITALKRAKVHPDTINELDGHEIAGERGRYGKAAELPELKAAIDAIAYPGISADLIRRKG